MGKNISQQHIRNQTPGSSRFLPASNTLYLF